jgi:aryl-alcohol dehydrogenase-like predicted oxidoreductase
MCSAAPPAAGTSARTDEHSAAATARRHRARPRRVIPRNLCHAITDNDAHSAVDAAWAGGVHYFDTALQYPLCSAAVTSVVCGLRTATEVESALDNLARTIPPAAWTRLAA